jgi:hypothetical protein
MHILPKLEFQDLLQFNLEKEIDIYSQIKLYAMDILVTINKKCTIKLINTSNDHK